MLIVCNNCTTAYNPGAAQCPHCGSTDYHEQGADMPKSTRATGATNKYADAPTEPTDDAPDAGLEMPAAAAPKSEWLDWASDAGAPETVLEGTKADIQAWAEQL